MNPDEAQISRVFARDVGASVEDRTFTITADFEVVVEVEAGFNIFNLNASYSIGVAVIDYDFDATAINNITPVFAGNNFAALQPGTLGAAPWTAQAAQIPFTVHFADLAGKADHMCKAYAFLRVGGGAEPQVSFADCSHFFLLIA